MMNRILSSLLVCATALLTGCFELEDTITVNADGSGHWKYRIKLGERLTEMQRTPKSKFTFSGNALSIEKEFRDNVRQVKGARVIQFKHIDDGKNITVIGELAFDSIEEMYRSRAFKEQFNWDFNRVGDRLVASITDGIMAGDKTDSGKFKFASMKRMMLGMKIDRTISLPNKVLSSNANESSGRKARYQLEINEKTTEEDYQRFEAHTPKATCSLEGVTFRLPMGNKVDLPEKMASDTASEDTQALLDKIEVTPDRAVLYRHQRYASENKMTFGNAPLSLIVEVSWPANLRPSGWSGLEIEHASDDKGTGLNLKNHVKGKQAELRQKFQKENASDIHIQLTEPARLAESYSVKGSILLHVPEGITNVKIPGIKDKVDQELEGKELQAIGLKVKSVRGTTVELVGDQATDSIVDVKMTSADGSTELKRFFMHRSKFRDEHRLRVGFQTGGRTALKNPTLIIVHARKVGKYKVPFEFKDLKMP